jgi:two-component system, OmpR family, sensor kinase
MSSSRPADPRGRVRRATGIESWPLRRRLIVEQVILLTMVCTLIVAVTLLALRAVLVNRLDDQLSEARGRVEKVVKPPPGRPGVPRGPEILDVQGPDSLTAVVSGNQVEGADQRTGLGVDKAIPPSAYSTFTKLPTDGGAYTRDLGELGTYRLTALQLGTGQVVVTGLPMSDVDSTLLSTGLILGGVALAGLLAAGGAGALIVRRALQPLRAVARTASRVAELPLDRGEVAIAERVPAHNTDPRTEVGQVGLALNRLLGHVDNALAARHESETRVRQFVADASHELRTPLAAVRGYAELVRRRGEAGQAMAPEVAHAIGRVESEAERMTALVEDLLLLARLDSGRPLDQSTVDLSRLVVDAVGDARVAGPEHHWRLDLPAEPVTAPGDAARLHQVLVNLLSNARTHTPPGTTITTGLSVSDGVAGFSEIELTVTDDGPGIPEDLRPEIFERFARGDSSRSRAAGSTGLGLAIVSAVVAAHGGDVDVSSRPGHTEFVVWLPGARPPDPGAA